MAVLGQNTLRICIAEMHRAMEFYLNNDLLAKDRGPVEVLNVQADSHNGGFNVTFRSKEKPEPKQC